MPEPSPPSERADVRLLDHRVAEAAEAWLAAPRDVAVYARLVAAVAERATALRGRSPLVRLAPDPVAGDAVGSDGAPRATDRRTAGNDGGDDSDDADDSDGADDSDDSDDSDADPPGPPLRPVGLDLAGDPRAVLERLRRG